MGFVLNCPRFDKKKKANVRCVTLRKIIFLAKDGKVMSKSFNNQPNCLNHHQPK